MKGTPCKLTKKGRRTALDLREIERQVASWPKSVGDATATFEPDSLLITPEKYLEGYSEL
jgi:hypothetical protein